MKKIKCLLLVILFIPFIVLAETKNVEIKNISNYVDKSDTAEELEKPSIEGLKLGFKLEFTKQDDFIKYKFIIKNNTDKDYEIDNSSTFNKKKSIRYDYEVENNAKVLKANEELSINVTITYVKELDDSEFENGVFTETNQVSLELVNDSNEVIDNPIIKMVTNPNTSTGYILLVIFAIILSLIIIILVKNKKVKMYLLIVLLIIPLSVYALEKIRLEVETSVKIIRQYTGVLYRVDGKEIGNNDRIELMEKWCLTEGVCYKTKKECESNIVNKTCDPLDDDCSISVCTNELVLKDDNSNYRNYNYYLKHNVVKGLITDTYACTKLDKDYCIKGGASADFEENKNILLEAYTSQRLSINEEKIIVNGYHSAFYKDGRAIMASYCGGCFVNADGKGYCENLNVNVC